MKKIKAGLLIILSMSFLSAQAETISIKMYKLTKTGEGKSIGTVDVQDTSYGLLLTPHLQGLAPGVHGFHVHQNPSCADAGKAAGGHLDPQQSDKHLGPYNSAGHLGDLPPLYFNSQGQAQLPVLAPRLTTQQLKGHSLMIHSGGDNYSDYPQKLGGGGDRIACGVWN